MDYEARFESYSQRADDARDPYDVDYARIIHSASFRRLQGKTQILNPADSDFHRTRLTHSLEVAQIGYGIVTHLRQACKDATVQRLLPTQSLISAVCLAHDLGHPPFGHGGEVALNYCMRDHGGFEGNGQSLRIVSKLEKFSEWAGANLTRRTLLGILKYPAVFEAVRGESLRPALKDGPTVLRLIDRTLSVPPKCYYASEAPLVDWLLQDLSAADRAAFTAITPGADNHARTRHKSFDCTIMDIADDLAYGVHDLEDAAALGFASETAFRAGVTPDICDGFLKALARNYPGEDTVTAYDRFASALFGDGSARKRQIGRLVKYLINSVTVIETEFAEPLLHFSAVLPPEAATLVEALKDFIYRNVIRTPRVQQLVFKGQQMVVAVFEAYLSEPETFLPPNVLARYSGAQGQGENLRAVADYIAGMTDDYLRKIYERLFTPRMGSVFDQL